MLKSDSIIDLSTIYRCLMMSDFIGLFGMFCSQSVMRFFLGRLGFQSFYQNHVHLFCFLILIWRFFGLSSGCVAFIMAVERFLALTKPFFYCQHITYGFVKKSIVIMWFSCALITFSPIVGFGVYFEDGKSRKCQRYRNASQGFDVVYAWMLFILGSLAFLRKILKFIKCIFRDMFVCYDGGLQLFRN